jgi:hypothetical protein
LRRLDEFTSPFINEVWKFFDELRIPPTYYEAPALPEPQTGIARDCCEYVKTITSFDKNKTGQEAADKCEREFIAAMRKKYPHLRWMPGRGANMNP